MYPRVNVAQRASVGIETLRYYEKQGLIPRPPRGTSNNYRLYPPETVPRVRFVKRAQELGFSLKEIKELLALRASPKARCADVRERSKTKISEIDEKIRSLRAMRKALLSLVAECRGKEPVRACPILDSLDASEEEL